MSRAVFVGLDCGGTTTRVVAIDNEGNILIRGQSGSANLASTPDEIIRANLQKAVHGCPSATAVCGCFAGLLTQNDGERALTFLRELFPGALLRAEPDAAAAFYAAEPRADICVIAGTGSLVCSLGPAGLIRSGGRGYLLGDEGSAFQFGRDAVRHFLDDPGATSRILREEILAVFETLDPAAIIAILYKNSAPAATLARFAQVLGDDAKSGEPYAKESVKRNASALATVAADHAKRYLAEAINLRIALTGGVWKILGMYEAFTSALTDALPECVIKVEVSRRPPVMGAVALAMEITLGN